MDVSTEDRKDLEELSTVVATWTCLALGHLEDPQWVDPDVYEIILDIVRYQFGIKECHTRTKKVMNAWGFPEDMIPGVTSTDRNYYLLQVLRKGYTGKTLDDCMWMCFKDAQHKVFAKVIDLGFGTYRKVDVDVWGVWQYVEDAGLRECRTNLLWHMGVMS